MCACVHVLGVGGQSMSSGVLLLCVGGVFHKYCLMGMKDRPLARHTGGGCVYLDGPRG